MELDSVPILSSESQNLQSSARAGDKINTGANTRLGHLSQGKSNRMLIVMKPPPDNRHGKIGKMRPDVPGEHGSKMVSSAIFSLWVRLIHLQGPILRGTSRVKTVEDYGRTPMFLFSKH